MLTHDWHLVADTAAARLWRAQSTRSQFEAAKQDWHARRVELETRLENERARMHDLTIAAESADDNVAALKHEIAVLRRHEEGALAGWWWW